MSVEEYEEQLADLTAQAQRDGVSIDELISRLELQIYILKEIEE